MSDDESKPETIHGSHDELVRRIAAAANYGWHTSHTIDGLVEHIAARFADKHAEVAALKEQLLIESTAKLETRKLVAELKTKLQAAESALTEWRAKFSTAQRRGRECVLVVCAGCQRVGPLRTHCSELQPVGIHEPNPVARPQARKAVGVAVITVDDIANEIDARAKEALAQAEDRENHTGKQIAAWISMHRRLLLLRNRVRERVAYWSKESPPVPDAEMALAEERALHRKTYRQLEALRIAAHRGCSVWEESPSRSLHDIRTAMRDLRLVLSGHLAAAVGAKEGT